MSNRRTWILAVLATLVLTGVPRVAASLTAPAPAGATAVGEPWGGRGTRLMDVQVSSGTGGHPTVALVGDGPLDYESFVLESPHRLVVDLKGVVNGVKSHQFPVGDGGVFRVRAGQYRGEPLPVVRIVFDLEAPPRYRIERQGDKLNVWFGEEETAAAVTPSSAPEESTEAPTAEVSDVLSLPQTPPAVPTESEEEKVASVGQGAETASSQAPPRALTPDAVDRLIHAPALAAEEGAPPASFETKTIATGGIHYTGKKISLNLVDADLKQVFRLFHEISGLNFVLDPSVEGRVTVVLDNVPWDQALDIILTNNGLDKTLENNVVRIATTQKLAQEAASRRQLKEAKELEVEPITITRTLSYAKAKEVERVIRDGGVLSPRGKVIVDERTNTLIISDIPKKVNPLDQLISSLDSETPQVMIEARIVETSREFVQDFGIQWGFNAIADASHGTSTGLAFPHNASARYGLNLPGGGGASSLNFSFGNVLDSFTLDVTLNALETEGRGRILSSPKIATQNNERAEIEQGVRIPIVNTTATEINVEFVSASLRLSVTPQITAEGTIILDIQVENNSPDFVNRVGTTPPINTQRAQTKVLTSDGGTTVIGGIFTVNESRSESGVPWFRKLPVFGWLFKARNITNENRELLIFITPKIMRIS